MSSVPPVQSPTEAPPPPPTQTQPTERPPVISDPPRTSNPPPISASLPPVATTPTTVIVSRPTVAPAPTVTRPPTPVVTVTRPPTSTSETATPTGSIESANRDGDSGGLPTGAIIGIAIVAAALLCAIIGWVCLRRKNSRDRFRKNSVVDFNNGHHYNNSSAATAVNSTSSTSPARPADLGTSSAALSSPFVAASTKLPSMGRPPAGASYYPEYGEAYYYDTTQPVATTSQMAYYQPDPYQQHPQYAADQYYQQGYYQDPYQQQYYDPAYAQQQQRYEEHDPNSVVVDGLPEGAKVPGTTVATGSTRA
ncbi:hypothetical protein HDU85_004276 [Gaertneriomyces sp. JEL0708]|nr:hypothetical protein HDU85_004276 [Gaertneriomyces sp. JEL0708]